MSLKTKCIDFMQQTLKEPTNMSAGCQKYSLKLNFCWIPIYQISKGSYSDMIKFHIIVLKILCLISSLQIMLYDSTHIIHL